LFSAIPCLLLTLALLSLPACKPKSSDEFVRLTNTGKNYYDRGEAAKAIAALEAALALDPAHPDAHLNLASAYLLANQPEKALAHAQEALKLNPNSAPALYVAGCACLRMGQAEPALKYLQGAKDIDRTINAVTFQLGRAHQQLGQFDEAANDFREVIQFEPEHPAAHYNLSQVLVRSGHPDEANQELAIHQKISAERGPKMTDPSAFERCVYTQVRAPFQLEMPAAQGVKVIFTDTTSTSFGAAASDYHGPAGVLDLQHDAQCSLFVAESNGFRLLLNSNGVFQPHGGVHPALDGAKFSRCLVGDLNNDGVEDVIVLGERGSRVFKFATNGTFTDVTIAANLASLSATNGALIDLNFSGSLGLLALGQGSNGLRFFRSLVRETIYFSESKTNMGLPSTAPGLRELALDDWNGDDLPDLFISRDNQPPLLLTQIRGGPLTDTNQPADWPEGRVIAVGDLNQDLRPDLVIGGPGKLVCVFNGVKERPAIPLGNWAPTSLKLVDYDNDGWLDIIATGPGLRIWRNLGGGRFVEMTAELGLEKIGPVESVLAADLDNDGDTDLLLTLADQSLKILRNDGGNANQQIKLHLAGTRSNASGIGVRVEVAAGGMRLERRVSTLPIEIGVGQHKQLDSLTTRWMSLNPSMVDVKVEPRTVLTVTELQIQETSCPYLYAWNGKRFRFVSDILGASPVGLPVAENHFIDSDPDEYVWIGNEDSFQPFEGNYLLQITEELREVLYLDEAKLVVVDHPAGTEAHPTDKLLPSKPFPPSQIITLDHRHPLLKATRLDGADATALLAENDGRILSPLKLRDTRLRGLAEPHGVIIDFGPLPIERPLVLALTGWLRFGGATANLAASTDPDLPFPFPKLEAETDGGEWHPVDVTVGAPAGKTKTILVDLAGKLPTGSRRLRLITAFEIHWDRIALFERRDPADTRITSVAPTSTDLHWHGIGQLEQVPWSVPQTPLHDRILPSPPWRVVPSGWCTRYGDVLELVTNRDNAMVLINSGDELTLRFAANLLPPKLPGHTRDFFLYSVGWDKDADFHTKLGSVIDPLPWNGMDDQSYGDQPRPGFDNDNWITKYNTRWVGPRLLTRKPAP